MPEQKNKYDLGGPLLSSLRSKIEPNSKFCSNYGKPNSVVAAAPAAGAICRRAGEKIKFADHSCSCSLKIKKVTKEL
jgi:hypothetical protein